MTPEEAAAVRDRACKGKGRYGPAEADGIVAKRNAQTPGVFTKYRCPWCRAYHVGHMMNVAHMEEMAVAIRVLGGDGPGDPAGTVPKRERRRQRRKA